MNVYSPDQLNTMTDDERKAVLEGEFGRSFHVSAAEHIAWIFWERDIDGPTEILGQGSAFILRREDKLFLVTAAHVYRGYLRDRERHGGLYCQVQNCRVRDLSEHLVACGNLNVPLNEPDRDADIAVFRLTPGAAGRIAKKPIDGPSGDWPAPPKVGENVMFNGFPGQERIITNPGEISFGFYSVMTPVTSITDHQISCRFDRECWADAHGLGQPPLGYGLGGISGGPLLIPDFRDGAWFWRLGGVISQAPCERPPEDVLFESVVSHRVEYILPDGTLAKLR
jgi:hypothetical protein